MAHEVPSRLRAFLSHAVLIALGGTMLLPFLWMVTTSLKSESEVFQKHLIPMTTSLGTDGAVLKTRDGRVLHAAIPLRDDDGMPRLDATGRMQYARGEPLRLRSGNPDMQQGSKGDRARTTPRQGAAENLSDDLGLPVLNGMVMTDAERIAELGGVARFRDPRIMGKYAEPVLVPRSIADADNEEMARRWFSRFDWNWGEMVERRWNGLVPLMLTEALRDAWASNSGKADPVVVNGSQVRNPHETKGKAFYQYKDLSWSEVGTPVRNNRVPTAIVDARGSPVPYQAPFPVYRSDDDPLRSDGNTDLIAFFGGKVGGCKSDKSSAQLRHAYRNRIIRQIWQRHRRQCW